MQVPRFLAENNQAGASVRNNLPSFVTVAGSVEAFRYQPKKKSFRQSLQISLRNAKSTIPLQLALTTK